jgi:hypothetical protein
MPEILRNDGGLERFLIAGARGRRYLPSASLSALGTRFTLGTGRAAETDRQTEIYKRRLDGFVADGPLPVASIVDRMFS